MAILLCTAYICAADPIYKSGSYQNIQRPMLMNYSSDQLINPYHHMSEGVIIDTSKTVQTASGIQLQSGAITYYTYFHYIPMERLWNKSNDKCIDYAYQGRIILFGEEYYTEDIDPAGFISACRGTVLGNITNHGYSGNYSGYNFRAEGLLEQCFDEGYCMIIGANFTVRRPDMSTQAVNVYTTTGGTIDNLKMSLIEINGIDTLNASLILYNTTDRIVLENGYTLQMADTLKNGWTTAINTETQPFSHAMNLTEYAGIKENQRLCTNATITYTPPITLNISTYLALPGAYKIVSNGTNLEVTDIWSTTTTTTQPICTLKGDRPPCNNIALPEIIGLINEWTLGTANIQEVMRLINAWARQA